MCRKYHFYPRSDIKWHEVWLMWCCDCYSIIGAVFFL